MVRRAALDREIVVRVHDGELFLGGVAVAHATVNRGISGSNPLRGAIELPLLRRAKRRGEYPSTRFFQRTSASRCTSFFLYVARAQFDVFSCSVCEPSMLLSQRVRTK